MTDEFIVLREAFNVADLKRRDRLVRQILRIRHDAVIEKNALEHWNRTHPDSEPRSTTYEESVIAWCDGTGPLPKVP